MYIPIPPEKNDAVRAMDGNHTDQKADSNITDYTPNNHKTQYNVFKISQAKGVVFTQSIKEVLKQKFECRYNVCFDAYICPIAVKEDVQSFLNGNGIVAKLTDVRVETFEKKTKVDSLETRLYIIERDINKSFEELIILVEKYDTTKAYYDFEEAPVPNDSDKSNDDIRFRIENDFHQRLLKIKTLEVERDNLRNSLNLHLNEEYDWPEPNPIHSALPKVPVFCPDTLLPHPLSDWVLDEADRMPCAPDYIGATAIVALGTIIGTRCAIKPKALDDWLVIANLWGAVVGSPSTKKSPAISIGLKALENLIKKATEVYQKALNVYETRKTVYEAQKEAIEYRIKAAAKKPEKGDLEKLANELKQHKDREQLNIPVLKRYKTNDTTVERLGELLRDNPTGILVLRDELVGLLVSWEREGREGDRAYFLEGWNGYSSFDSDRIKRGNINVLNLCISVFGGIQPDKLTVYLEQASRALSNDGMLQRIQVLVYPDPCTWKWRDKKPNKEIRDQVVSIFEMLANFNPLDWGATPSSIDVKIPYFQFDEEAQQVFIDWTSDLHLKRIPLEENHLISQHLEKYDKLFCSVALICHLIECATRGLRGPITAVSARRAVAWCEYLEGHARRCYGLLADDGLRSALTLSEKIKKGQLKEGFTARDVRRNQWTYLTTNESVQAALEWLEDEKWIRSFEVGGKGPGSGRRTYRYSINPKAFSKVV